MGIYLGNLTIKELEEKHSITLSDEHRSALESMRQNNADNVKSDKFHIFDIPRVIACGSKDTAIKVYEILKQYSIKGHIEIAVESNQRT